MSTAVVEDFCITTDKLDEWKEVVPKAGPKFRLGKYFDTIYEIPEFDAIKEPDGGYLSCWDTDTDINTDDEGNNFLFANVDGDSASVICLDDDEAVRLIKRWKAKEMKHLEQSPLIAKLTDQESSTKPGSDGTYEIVDGEEITPEEHIYESIEDCTNTPEYQIFVGGNHENTSPLNTPTHVTVTQRNVTRKSSSPSFKTKRANSLPTSSGSSPKFARKYSDCTEYTRLRRRPSDPKPPPPLPPPNNTGIIGVTSGEYSQLFRLSGKVSPPNENKTTSISPPSMILKHKGKSYVLPIAESGKGTKAARRQSTGSNGSPKHVPSSTSNNNLQQQQQQLIYSTLESQLTPHRYPVPRSISMGFQGSNSSKNQISPASVENTPRRKLKHNSTHSSHYSTSTSQSNKSHMKLYGVL